MEIFAGIIWCVCAAGIFFLINKWYLSRFVSEQVSVFGGDNGGRWFLMVSMTALPGVVGYTLASRNVGWSGWIQVAAAILFLEAAAVIDTALCQIPNKCVFGMAAARLLLVIPEILNGETVWWLTLLGDFCIAMIVMLALFIVCKITHEGIGYGDIKLFGGLGFLCGFQAMLYTLLLSVSLCAAAGALLLLLKKKGLKDGLPMAPFVYIGFVLAVCLCTI